MADLLKTKPEFFTAAYLSKVSKQEVKSSIYLDKNFCLLEERSRLLRELGTVTLTYFNGKFEKILTFNKDLSAPKLIKTIIDFFPGFRDQAIYKGHQVFFYKRAQILVTDIIVAFQEMKESPFIIKN